jgi:hypothetical protein
MTEAKSGKPETDAAIGELFAAALLREGELWMNTHKELLAGVAALTESWRQLHRAALDAFARALDAYSDPAALFRLQQEWMSSFWGWAAAAAPAGAEDGVHVAREAASRSREPVEAGRADILVRRQPAKSAAEAATAAE